MPGIVAKDDAARKRKRTGDASAKSSGVKPRKAPKTSSAEDTQAKVLELEAQILESPDYYGNIVTLQKYTSEVESHPGTATLAAVSLCRVFCRLIASEELVRRKDASDKDAQVVQMLMFRPELIFLRPWTPITYMFLHGGIWHLFFNMLGLYFFGPALESRLACLLANHGMIATGPDLAKALWLAVEMESLCRQYAIALQVGTPVILSDDEIARNVEKFRSYGPRAEG